MREGELYAVNDQADNISTTHHTPSWDASALLAVAQSPLHVGSVLESKKNIVLHRL